MYRKEPKGWVKHFDFILLDNICMQAAFALSYVLMGQTGNPYSTILYRSTAIVMGIINLVALIMMEDFKGVLRRGYYKEFRAVFWHTAVVSCGSTLYLFLVQNAQAYSRLTFIHTFILYAIITYIARGALKAYLKTRLAGAGAFTLLVVTSRELAESVLENIKEHNYARYQIAGLVVLGEDMTGETVAGVPVVASEQNAAMYVCQQWIDEVLVIPSKMVGYPQEMLDQLEETGVTVHLHLAKANKAVGRHQFVEKLADYTVLTTTMNTATTRQAFAKRMLDIVGSLVGCLLTVVIFIFVAPAIYLASPGPIFFAQERVGKNGKKFKIYKFRSMYLDAEERKAELMKENKICDGKMFKMDFDPRVIGNKILPDGTKKTGIGQFIRDTSLDEFPQFFNVLMGDMSLVGTRPPLMGEVSLYELHHRSRLAIKPGITGMWQVCGRSEIVDFEEVVRLDKQYISQWDIGLDIKIILKTIEVVIRRNGSM